MHDDDNDVDNERIWSDEELIDVLNYVSEVHLICRPAQLATFVALLGTCFVPSLCARLDDTAADDFCCHASAEARRELPSPAGVRTLDMCRHVIHFLTSLLRHRRHRLISIHYNTLFDHVTQLTQVLKVNLLTRIRLPQDTASLFDDDNDGDDDAEAVDRLAHRMHYEVIAFALVSAVQAFENELRKTVRFVRLANSKPTTTITTTTIYQVKSEPDYKKPYNER